MGARENRRTLEVLLPGRAGGIDGLVVIMDFSITISLGLWPEANYLAFVSSKPLPTGYCKDANDYA